MPTSSRRSQTQKKTKILWLTGCTPCVLTSWKASNHSCKMTRVSRSMTDFSGLNLVVLTDCGKGCSLHLRSFRALLWSISCSTSCTRSAPRTLTSMCNSARSIICSTSLCLTLSRMCRFIVFGTLANSCSCTIVLSDSSFQTMSEISRHSSRLLVHLSFLVRRSLSIDKWNWKIYWCHCRK